MNPRLTTIPIPCPRCHAVVDTTYAITPEGLETPPGRAAECGRCGYKVGDPLPGVGYCAPCWNAGTLTKLDTSVGMCVPCLENA